MLLGVNGIDGPATFSTGRMAATYCAMTSRNSERNLNNKTSRGGFSAVFLIQCLAAAGGQTVRISED